MYEVADGLHPRRMSEEAPSLIGKAIDLTIAAAKQEQHGGFGNFLSLGETDMVMRNTKTGALEVYDISTTRSPLPSL